METDPFPCSGHRFLLPKRPFGKGRQLKPGASTQKLIPCPCRLQSEPGSIGVPGGLVTGVNRLLLLRDYSLRALD